METAVALRVFLASLESFRDDAGRALAVITGEDSPLRGLAASLQCQDIFTIPESIGGRFSVLTAVGLLPAAIMGLDIRRLLQGAAAMTTSCRENPLGENPVLDHAATGIIAETQHELTIRVLSVWSRGLESLGSWHDQLLSESLGKDGRGATPLTAVNTRDLHSRGQQHQQGRRDKLITNLVIDVRGNAGGNSVACKKDGVDAPKPDGGWTKAECDKHAGAVFKEGIQCSVDN